MSGRQLFTLLGVIGLAVFLYQRFVNPRCAWCGAALKVLATGQTLACPSCGHVK